MTEFTSFTCLECGEAQGIHRSGCSRLQRSVPVSALQDLIAELKLRAKAFGVEGDTDYEQGVEYAITRLEALLPK